MTAMTTNPTPCTPPVTTAHPERAPSVGALRPVHELAADFARVHPKRPAVLRGCESIGYGELNAWADQSATWPARVGVCRGDRVAVLVEPSVGMIAAALGVLRSEAAYVPAGSPA